MRTSTLRRALLAGAAIQLVGASAALAQTASDGQGNVLGEIVVTATRQSDTVSRVPLSVTAVTQANLDQQRVTSINDIARTVPSITFRQTGYDQSSTIAIRGVYTQNGAATTGIYLDDTPISKRGFVNGGAGGANDTPLPHLFDLQRIEVLRGPQGTLFGASAEGGAIRYIYNEPSLTTYSGFAKAGGSVTKDGDPSYEGGVAFGGPIIPDKLGFRMFVEGGHTGGYLDHVSPYTGKTFAENTDWGDSKGFRAALTWQVNDRLRITPSYYYGEDYRADVSSFIENVPGFTLNSGYFINKGVSKNGVPFNFPTTYFAGGTFGPFNMFGPYKTPIGSYDADGNGSLQHSPAKRFLSLPSLKIEYDFGGMDMTSVTSFVHDHNRNETWGQNSGTLNRGLPLGTYNTAQGCFSSNPNTCVPVAGGPEGVGNPALNPFYPGFANLYYHYYFRNQRDQFTQELRFSSKKDARPLQWQAGVYYYNSHSRTYGNTAYNEGQLSEHYRGFNVLPYVSGVTDLAPDGGGTCFNVLQKVCFLLPGQTSNSQMYSAFFNRFYENEISAFGEASYWLTDKLKATAGLRMSRFTTNYGAFSLGSTSGPSFAGTASHPYPVLPGDPTSPTITSGVLTENPVTPKFSLSYQATENDMFYTTAAKGYRNGGVNSVGTLRADCVAQLASFGLTSVPETFTSDGVWSYEAGAKMRFWGGRAQVNTSAFYIDWKEPQLSVRIPCGTSFITNAGHAVSKGVDFDARVRVIPGLTASLAGGWTKAEYVEDTVAKDPTSGALSYTVHKGDTLPIPEVQYTFGLDYVHEVVADWIGNLHFDYQYASKFKQTVGPGGVGYNVNLYHADSSHFATASAGLTKDGLDLQLYVKNLTNSTDRLSRLQGAGAAVMTYSYRPREVGFTISKQF